LTWSFHGDDAGVRKRFINPRLSVSPDLWASQNRIILADDPE
jgi:hypothetical protein